MSTFDPTRRQLLKAAAWLPLASACGRLAFAGDVSPPGAAQVSLVVHPERLGRVVSDSLAGFSYETQQLENPAFFSADNHALVRLFRDLSPRGVLRIGGNSSDYTVWTAYRGEVPAQRTHKGGPQRPVLLKPEALHTLAGFLRATGWKLVFGVNLKIGVPAMAVELAQAVRQIVGENLIAIQIGNEANNYEADYGAFDQAWTPYAKAIRDAGVPIAGPDTGANTDWVIEYAKRHAGENVFLSRHYYKEAAPRGSIADLLAGDAGFHAEVEQAMQAADISHRPFRLTEANSYYLGGRDGVSNVFASALWGADFMLAMAQRGVAGVHFHGGTLDSIEASLGRTADASATATDQAARRDAVTSRYSAIAGDATLGFQARPLYYGMQLAQQFAGAQMVAADLDAAGVNLTAYAAMRGHALLIALINKDAGRDATVSLNGLRARGEGRLMRLRAPALDSRSGLVFEEGADAAHAGREVTVDARGRCSVVLPRGSAALLRLDRFV
ncbi:glycosyl hydrolase family 79 C-terminal domain-containing protein [Dyella sp. EPa41]|uniref:glycosyl hydrolase family 79 C-terminal domain-containing protein n=1 Tax=Dyella sp. EPa41 TaxID=1561194 RepID=UPI001915A54D|nr:glycosyl hydrolase family 79 C-terminal domain-containing protein [Dyella sp. EPa41]